jgi:hypothetical protein
MAGNTIGQTRVSSITRNGRYEPFDLQVGRNQIGQHYPVELFGYSTQVANTAYGPCWEGLTQSGGAYAYPSSAVQMTLVSTTTDTMPVMVMGVDANWNLQQEIVTLNGTTGVNTVNNYLRINALYITNGGFNAGTITCKNGGVTYAQINIGIGQTQMSIYSVPKGYTFYLSYIQANASIGFTSSAYMLFAEYNKFNLPVNEIINGYPVSESGNATLLSQSPFVQIFEIPYTVPVGHAAGTDIQYQVKSSTGGPFVASIFAGGILIANADVGST